MRFVDDEKAGDILIFLFFALVMLTDIWLFVEVSGVR